MGKSLAAGITRKGSGEDRIEWNILGQHYFAKAVCDSSFAFETNSDPGQFVPEHIHPNQDEFILVLEGTLDLKLNGQDHQAHPGDLVRMPKGIPHAYYNNGTVPAKALFWVSPAGKLKELFDNLHNLSDVQEVVRLSALHEVDFLPPK